MQLLTLDKNFVVDNFSFVQDKKCFVPAEGRGIYCYPKSHQACSAYKFLMRTTELHLEMKYMPLNYDIYFCHATKGVKFKYFALVTSQLTQERRLCNLVAPRDAPGYTFPARTLKWSSFEKE